MAAKYTAVLRGIPGAFGKCPTMSSLNRKNGPNSCGEKSFTGAKPRDWEFLIQSISIFIIIRFPHSLSLGLAPAGFHFDPSLGFTATHLFHPFLSRQPVPPSRASGSSRLLRWLLHTCRTGRTGIYGCEESPKYWYLWVLIHSQLRTSVNWYTQGRVFDALGLRRLPRYT